jgi:mono/diheme cytochrome c family protein
MISARMNRPLRVILYALSLAAVAMGAAACGTERINVPRSDPNQKADFAAAELFQEHCAGCHTLSYAATHGSGGNPRTYENINGPNFDKRCERPAMRVLYAIENGGFSGAYMPQNVLVGQQARQVAMFVARFSGRQAQFQPGSLQASCQQQPIGTLPALPTNPNAVSASTATTTTASTATTGSSAPSAAGTATPKPKRKTKKK